MVEAIIPRRGRTPKTPPPALTARLVQARRTIGATQKELAKQLGCAWRSVQDYEQGKAVPGGQVLASYGELGVDLNWLLNGTDAIETSRDGDFIRVPNFQLSDIDADFSAAASASSLVQLNESWLEELISNAPGEIDASQTASITVEDDAMAPEIPNGSLVIFDTCPVRPAHPGLYVMPLTGQLAVRLIRANLDGHREIIELRHPARPIVIDNSRKALPNAYRVITTLSAQVYSKDVL